MRAERKEMGGGGWRSHGAMVSATLVFASKWNKSYGRRNEHTMHGPRGCAEGKATLDPSLSSQGMWPTWQATGRPLEQLLGL